MATYSEQDASDARRIVESLVAREIDGVELDSGLVVSDVEEDARSYMDQLEIIQNVEAKAPVLRLADESIIPISLDEYLPDRFPLRSDWSYLYSPDWLYYLRDTLRRGEQESESAFVEPEEARNTFVRRATDFLATRIEAIRAAATFNFWPNLVSLQLPRRAGDSEIPTAGCLFSVSTNSSGLSVYWSGAYLVAGKYFNHPTSPAQAPLQTGTYIFGVKGGGYGDKVRWDRDSVVQLPGPPRVHLMF